jgi:hypothetical protein
MSRKVELTNTGCARHGVEEAVAPVIRWVMNLCYILPRERRVVSGWPF